MSYEDPAKHRERARKWRQRFPNYKREYRLRKRIERYGEDAVTTNYTGKHATHANGDSHPRWNRKGSSITKHGYRKIRVGASHVLADLNGFAYEHLLVWCEAGNARPARDEVIHHINGNKLDNRIENLQVMKRTAHNALHIRDHQFKPKERKAHP